MDNGSIMNWKVDAGVLGDEIERIKWQLKPLATRLEDLREPQNEAAWYASVRDWQKLSFDFAANKAYSAAIEETSLGEEARSPCSHSRNNGWICRR